VTRDLKETVSDTATWRRLLYMLLFVLAFNLAAGIVAVVVIVQFLLKLFTGEVNPRLQRTGGEIGVYLRKIVAFLAYQTEAMPYPFAAWEGEAEPIVTPAPKPARPRRRVKRPTDDGAA
jgi:hypothetical protein